MRRKIFLLDGHLENLERALNLNIKHYIEGILFIARKLNGTTAKFITMRSLLTIYGNYMDCGAEGEGYIRNGRGSSR